MKLRTVQRIDSYNAGSFEKLIGNEEPFIFPIGWRALEKWSTDYLMSVAGDAIVNVSAAIDESSSPTSKVKAKFRDYIIYLVNKYANNNDSDKKPPYLKQFEIFKHYPELKADVDFSFLPGVKEMAFWLGARGSVTGLHCDPNHGVLGQVLGKKELYLFPYSQRAYLYPNSKYDPATECCDPDVRYPDYTVYPRLSGAEGLFAELEAGEAIFMPKKWYHQVVGKSINISVNCFFYSYTHAITTNIVAYRLPKMLHNAGLYRTGYCVCHPND
ncbi:cupin-like domain-containing protein [Mesorhizobium sp. MSK_1335]|uniref:Cupin-like domain-containing protein n=1 Tax=Mesorhizobium montanum TaxID=3072323 RepID=A0ABU4ZKL3_9HYPH|nr:cupin-like domain-containing protein [Mesorhizobium sp. MSK_1335]MDX8525902.1 cupin-like domain-containing protein [Mesorhizobium sp. MSK_1335]